ncbi:MAG: alkaline phosphatase family protein, partial [Acetobacteraceae bacterium]
MNRSRLLRRTLPGSIALGALLAGAGYGLAGAQAAGAKPAGAVAPAPGAPAPQDGVPTATPIKHLVVIYGENVSFDHYFATYPQAANPPGEPRFVALPGTPKVDNLVSAWLLPARPGPRSPFRLDRSQAKTADQNHAYTAEQLAYHGGRNDRFPRYVGRGTPGGAGEFATKAQVMGYYDGNTVTAMWMYAQHFAMSDN